LKTAILTETLEATDQQRFLKLIEILFLFIGTPIILWLEIPSWTKNTYFFTCVGYVI
jgi:hypothetical protein